MPSSRRARRLTTALAVLTTTSALVAGCAVGPDPGPDVVRGDNPGADQTDAPKQPELQAPERDLNWRPCASRIDDLYSMKVPAGVTVECARYEVPVDPSSAGGEVISIGAMRAKKERTPADAVPLVLTSGTDLPSSRTLLELASGEGASLLDRNPVVAVDFRGTGLGASVDCLSNAQRDVLAANGAGRGRDATARAAAIGTAARAGADLCTDTLSPDQLAYSIDSAAADLEQLRDRWNVERLALIGVGDGSSVVLRYAAEHKDNVGRLVLDSPTGYNVAAREAARTRARGVARTLTTFAQRCSGAGCALGADGVGMVSRVLTDAASGGLPGMSDAEILEAVTTALAVGDTAPEGLKTLGAAIAAADRGDPRQLRPLVDAARALRGTDGRLVGRCNDLRGRPGVQEVPALAREWGAQSPLTGVTAALDLVDCDGWGTTDPPAAPDSLAVDPLILVNGGDPFNGADSVETLSPMLLAAKAAPTLVSWDGLGFSVLARSGCAAGTVQEYLGVEPLKAPAERACPA